SARPTRSPEGARKQKARSPGRNRASKRLFWNRLYPTLRTFCACSPFGPFTTSNSTFWPSARVRKPSALIAVWWQNTSSPPPSCVMKPKPFVSLNHFTVPVAIRDIFLRKSGRLKLPSPTPELAAPARDVPILGLAALSTSGGAPTPLRRASLPAGG